MFSSVNRHETEFVKLAVPLLDFSCDLDFLCLWAVSVKTRHDSAGARDANDGCAVR